MQHSNQLFPVFLKLEHLKILIIGGGEVGFEKLTALFNNCQTGDVTVVAEWFSDEVSQLALSYPTIQLIKKSFEESDVLSVDIVIGGTAISELNKQVHQAAKKNGKLVNVADTPALCDFYLSSIVQKGDLKIAISSNGKSPTMTKRLREFFDDVIPLDVNDILQNLHRIRAKIKGDFQAKMDKMNEVTKTMSEKSDN